MFFYEAFFFVDAKIVHNLFHLFAGITPHTLVLFFKNGICVHIMHLLALKMHYDPFLI